MNKIIYLLLLLILFIFSSCEKEEFASVTEEPVFIAGVPFSKSDSVGFNAGDDLYYMYASHIENEEEIVYSGLFGKDETCTSGCSENFSIQFHQKIEEESKLDIGSYDFYSIPRDGYNHSYTLATNDTAPLENSFWRIGSETLLGETVSVDSNNDTAPGDGIRLLYNIPNILTVQFERQIIPMTVDCDISVRFNNTNLGVEIEVITSAPFAQVSWSTGEISNVILMSPSISTYTARVFAGSGCTTDIAINIEDLNLVGGYNIGFNQTSVGFTTPDNANNAVSISYTDENGVYYTSSTIGQILPFRFDVSDVSDYDANELGDPTWKIDASFDCILFGENGKTRRIENGNAVFAVSHK